MEKTAILVDGGFYTKRANYLWGSKTPEDRAKELVTYCMNHLQDKNTDRQLYRIFYYDCPPLNKKMHHPLTNNFIDFGKSDLYMWMTAFLDELRKKRKFALRLGQLVEGNINYTLKANIVKKLCNGTLNISDLKENDFTLNISQKGVDMKIGLDISSMAHKNQVSQIVLISGDSDFVPAAKHARREGVDFILDPMHATIRPDLQEHIDGLKTYAPKIPKASK